MFPESDCSTAAREGFHVASGEHCVMVAPHDAGAGAVDERSGPMRSRPAWLAGAVVAAVTCGTILGVYLRADRSLERIRERGSIRVGYAVEAPFAFLGRDGEVTGEAPELARRVAAGLGIPRIEWRQTEFDNLIGDLEAGRIDVVAAGMFITAERERRVAFSVPTFRVRQGLLVRRGNPSGLHSYEEALSRPSLRIAVLAGSVEEQLIRTLGASAQQLVVVPDALSGQVAVEAALADGLALSSPTIRWIVLRDRLRATEPAEPFEQPPHGATQRSGLGAFAFRAGDDRLRRAWDGALRGLLGSPEHAALTERFGFTPAERLGPPPP